MESTITDGMLSKNSGKHSSLDTHEDSELILLPNRIVITENETTHFNINSCSPVATLN